MLMFLIYILLKGMLAMNNKKLIRQLQSFDPDLWNLLHEALDRQLSSLSLIPTDSAASPFSSYLKGSVLGNDFIGHHTVDHYGRLETMAAKRACELFNAEHAIVRTGNWIAASRVVLLALLKTGDTILSFNLRKQEYCTGAQMQYNFIKFALEPDTLKLNFDKLRYLAIRHKPKLIIYSPVNYPHNIDYSKLRKVADEVGAYLWIDLGQNSGLIAAGKIKSPIPYADVATFAASDALHGPQTGVILSKNKLAELLDRTVIDTGHASLKKNVLAALAITFHEASCEEYRDYSQQVLNNAQALEKGLKSTGVDVLLSPTENHLVLVRLSDNQDGNVIADKLAQGNLLVKAEKLMTSNDNINYKVLRLSSLDPTTRSLIEEDMYTIGLTLGEFLQSPQDSRDIKSVSSVIKEIVEGLPLFSEEWLPADEAVKEYDPDLMMKAMVYWNM